MGGKKGDINPTWGELQGAAIAKRLEAKGGYKPLIDGSVLHLDPFKQVLEELAAMHDKKNKDYGRDTDPYANVRGSQEWGVQPWVGAMVRANDKMKRLQKAAQGDTLVNESVEDSLLDLAVYAMIALVLFREAK